MPTDETDPLLRYAEVAAQLGVSLRTAQKYALEEGLEVVRLGHRTVRVRQSALNAWLVRRHDVGNDGSPAAAKSA